MRKYICIEYFQSLPCLCFANVRSVEENVKVDIKNIKSVEDTKVGGISGRKCIDKI